MPLFPPGRGVRIGLFLVILCAAPSGSSAQNPRGSALPNTAANVERVATLNLEAARNNPPQLRHFLREMPKGSDLHVHVLGAIYAESLLRQGAEEGLCIQLASLSFVKSNRESGTPAASACEQGQVPAAHVFEDQKLYDAMVDAFSMRGYVPSPGVTAHDHFFSTFARFSVLSNAHLGEWVDEIAHRAGQQNEQYLELMHTPDFQHAASLALQIGWRDDLAALRNELLGRGLRDDVAIGRADVEHAEKYRRKQEKCGEPDADRACGVETRYLYQVLRGLRKEIVFAQAVLAFETASADPQFVGINFVMPEDGYVSMTDYALHMRMLDFLHGLYPKVHISLHAGEIGPGLVPYEGLCCHIRMAIEQGHAERIGHGADVMYEDRPHELLKEMAEKNVMVEVNLTSNDVILGMSGDHHPLRMYRMMRVPVSLSTDDEGVSRIDLTHEYVRAVQTYGYKYGDLKQMIRTGMEHIFLPGVSLWLDGGTFRRMNAACVAENLEAATPSAACSRFLESSEKARQQFELERRFHKFEKEL